MRLSLCMIVRDEAAMLPGLLAAGRGLWDELCAVDTGSRDHTPALLAAAGARLAHQAWDGDFAAARNRSLELATGDWILFLDADERPTPELIPEVRALLADDAAGAATLVMRNALPHGGAREARLLRLFRRDPAIRFRHRIHEEPATDVAAYLRRTGRRLVALAGRVDHLGYVREVAAARDKRRRDQELLAACLDADPDDWYSWYKLLESARFWDDRALWGDAARRLAPRLATADLRGRPWGGELLALCAQGAADAPARQWELLARWTPRADPSFALHVRRGALRETLGDAAGAAAEFARCLELPAAGDPTLGVVRPRLGLCRLAAAAGDLAAARAHLREALAHGPRDPEALLAGLSFAWLAGGRAARDRFVAERPPSEELTAAVGEHALLCGLWDDARAAWAALAGDPPRGRAALRLAEAALGGGDAAAALDLCRSLAGEPPEAAVGHLVCALALGRDVDLTIDLEPRAADAALRAWVSLLGRGRAGDLRERFADHAPAVYGAFPWLAAELGRRAKVSS